MLDVRVGCRQLTLIQACASIRPLGVLNGLPLVGRDRDDVWSRVERHRGRGPAATFAARHHAGTATEHAARFAGLAERGVTAAFVAPVGLDGPDDVLALAPLATAFG